MRKAKPAITRHIVRRVIAGGLHWVEAQAAGTIYHGVQLSIENRVYEVIYVKRKAHLLVVTTYEKGEYD